jgi:hypothetical protein
LKLRSFQFRFNNFSTMNGLYYIGDIYIDRRTMYFRVRSTRNSRKSGALWHCLKQRIEQGFKSTFAFSFKNQITHPSAMAGTSAMNASVISNSMAGSPSKHRNNFGVRETVAFT